MPSPSTDTSLTFAGGAGTVTGSKYVVRYLDHSFLLDCGLFQGLKSLRLRNWAAPPFDPAVIDAVVLSHAHLDHSGYLPLLARRGFRGQIHCTSGTADLVAVVLRDSARLQEEDADHANRHKYSKHAPALPLYTAADAEDALGLLVRHPYGEPFEVVSGASATFRRAGHILGSATVDVELDAAPGRHLVFSGDLGRRHPRILRERELVSQADVLLVESTYGNRLHAESPDEEIARIVNETAERRGALIVPAFAIGRTQEFVWLLRQLEDQQRVPSLPVYVDSPMAINVTDIYCRHPEDHDLDMKLLMDEKLCPLCCRTYGLVRSPQESKSLNDRPGPMIVIAGSGMATGGRVLHHLERRLPDPRNTVLLVGFQAEGTRGRSLRDGASSIRMHGVNVPVRARIENVDGLSAHADKTELMEWLKGFERPPDNTYVVHGEAAASHELAAAIERDLGWRASVAVDGATVSLGGAP